MADQEQDIHPVGTTPISSQAKQWTPKQLLNMLKPVDIDGPQGALNRPDDSDPDKPNKEGLYRGRHPSRSTILAAPAGPNWGEEGLPGEDTATATATMEPVGTPVTVAPGSGYAPTNELTLVGGTFTEAGVLVVGSVKTILGQDETNYSVAELNGTFVGGTGHAASDSITMSDGTVVLVDAVSAGVVTQFTITTISTTPHTSGGDVITQSSTTGSGIGFVMTLDVNNQGVFAATHKIVATVTVGEYTVLPADPVAVNFGGATFNVDWGVKNVTVTAGGLGYALPPAVGFSDTGGSGTTATSAITGTSVTSVTVTAPGAGYSARATVAFASP